LTAVTETAPSRHRVDWWQLLRDELSLSPVRRSRMLRMTGLAALVVVISMALRVPEAGVSAYMIFFVLQADKPTTVRAGIALVVGLTVALALCFFFFSLAVAEPVLRLPLMALLIFGGMYLMSSLRGSPLAPLGLVLGFITSYSLTYADQLPSPEAMVHGLLWQWVVVAYPIGLVVLTDLAFGSRPEDIYRGGLAARLGAVADVLGAPAEEDAVPRKRLERLVRAGVADLARYVKRGEPAAPVRASLLRQVELLGFLTRELPQEVKLAPTAGAALRRASEACLGARRALLGQDRGRGGARLESFTLLADERRRSAALSPAALAVVLPLVACIQTVALGVHQLLAPAVAGDARPEPERAATPSPRSSNRSESARFGSKVTLAAMTAYLLYTGLAWFSIHTAMITCFFVAEDSLGATIHKLTLRVAGAVVGVALGMAAIIFVLPKLDSVGGLAVLVAAVTLFAAWFATASERISYAGWQIAIAFYLTVLQGFSRTSKLYVGRDRVIGILLGNVLMTVVFASLWPVRIKPALQQALSRSLEALAAMLRLDHPAHFRLDDRLDQLEAAFDADLAAARRYAPLGRFEGRGDPASRITVVEGLLIPIHAVVADTVGGAVAAAPPAARKALSALREGVAGWLSALAASIAAEESLPAFQVDDEALATLRQVAGDAALPSEMQTRLGLHLDWFELLHMQIEKIAQGAPG
jgi:multidrug resistance protein MdtO